MLLLIAWYLKWIQGKKFYSFILSPGIAEVSAHFCLQPIWQQYMVIQNQINNIHPSCILTSPKTHTHSFNTHLLTEEQKHWSKTEHHSLVAEIEHILSRPAQNQRQHPDCHDAMLESGMQKNIFSKSISQLLHDHEVIKYPCIIMPDMLPALQTK